MLTEPLMDDGASNDKYQWPRLIVTVTAVALGSSLQFGYATGSLNNLEQIVPVTLAAAGNPIVTWQCAAAPEPAHTQAAAGTSWRVRRTRPRPVPLPHATGGP